MLTDQFKILFIPLVFVLTINVTSNDDGIRGKDYIGIKNSNLTIKAGGDGLKSTNDTEPDKGYIILENFHITNIIGILK